MNQEYLVLLYILSCIPYIVLNHRKTKYHYSTRYDSIIPFIAMFVIPYLFFFVFIPFTIVVLWDKVVLSSMLWTLVLANIAASIFWYLVPNGIKRYNRKEKGMFVKLVNWVYKIDNNTNGFPSGHVYSPLIAAYFANLAYPDWGMGFNFVAVLVAISTVFVKQHTVVDVIGGLVWFFSSVYISKMVL